MAEIPFFRFVLPLVLGIATAHDQGLSSYNPKLIIFLLLCLSAYIFLLIWNSRKHRKLVNLASSALIFILFYLTGITIYSGSRSVLSEHKIHEQKYKLRVSSAVQGDKYSSLEAVVLWSEKDIQLEGKKILVRISGTKEFNVGDIYFASLQLHPFEKESYPLAFNVKEYYHSRSVMFHAWSDDALVYLGSSKSAKVYFSCLRDKINTNLSRYFNSRDLSLIRAMVLGDRRGLDQQLKDQFIRTGTMHMLAVSGMHVGAIYLVFFWLFKTLLRDLRFRVFLTLALVWIYAFLSGLGPPVQRAALMASLIAASQLLKRDSYAINTLLVCAFVILVLDPQMYLSVSFRFSFVAVLSILLFYKKFECYYQPKYELIKRMWQLTCLGVSAQVLIFPLSLYYFHQFSVLFVLSGLLVVPYLMLVFYFGLAFIVLSSVSSSIISGIACYVHMVIDFTIWMNKVIGDIPFALYYNMDFKLYDVLAYYILLYTALHAIKSWKRGAVFISALTASCLMLVPVFRPNLCIIKSKNSRSELLLIEPAKVYHLRDGNGYHKDSYQISRLLDKLKKTRAIIDMDYSEVNNMSDLSIIGSEQGNIILWNKVILQLRECNQNAVQTNNLRTNDSYTHKRRFRDFRVKDIDELVGEKGIQSILIFECQDYVIEM